MVICSSLWVVVFSRSLLARSGPEAQHLVALCCVVEQQEKENNNNDSKTLPYSDTVSSSMHWGLEIKGRFGDGYLKFVFSVCRV